LITRSHVKQLYEQLAKAARRHAYLQCKFAEACNRYYGFEYSKAEINGVMLVDDDILGIPGTLDYGDGSNCSFDDFDKAMQKAKKELIP
jgi:hypothetical protein